MDYLELLKKQCDIVGTTASKLYIGNKNDKSYDFALCDNVMWHEKSFKDLLDDDVVTILDSEQNLNALFFEFCADKNIQVSNLDTDFLFLDTSDSDDENMFLVHGACKLFTEDFEFIKVTQFLNIENNSLVSFNLIRKNDLDKYLEFKKSFDTWHKNKHDKVVQVIGSDPYELDKKYTWDDLFFGEKAELKQDVANHVASFFDNEKQYKENNIPWKSVFLIRGPSGSGKSELLNTIISEYDFNPITVSPTENLEAFVSPLLGIVSSADKVLFFLEDIDLLLDNDIISIEMLYTLIDEYRSNKGIVFVFTTTKNLDKEFGAGVYRFDKVWDIGNPEYKASFITTELTTNLIDTINKKCETAEFTYKYLYKFKELFSRQVIKTLLPDRTENRLLEIADETLKTLVAEQTKTKPSKRKKVGL